MVLDDGTPRALRVDAVWDIETEDWDTFVVGALWVRDEGVFVYRSEDELAEHLLSLPKGTVAWAHAGGRFDVLWLLDWCHRHDRVPASAQIRMSGSTISALAIKGGPILRDSFRLIPMSLSKACRMFDGQRKTELGLPCKCGDDCGGYCSISRKMPAKLFELLRSYLVADVEALRDTLEGLVTYAAQNAIILGGTVASSSWKTAADQCLLPDADWTLPAYRMARAGYYGGRVGVGIVKAPKIFRYDRQSAYPAALTESVPLGAPSFVPAAEAARAYTSGRPGIYSALVEVPEMHACPLPYRVANRIAYPWGKLRGTWPRDELARAEEVGARILRFDDSLIFPTEGPALRSYVERVFKLRHAAPTKELGQWLKWLANSLTGAFAQDPEQDLFAIGDLADDARWLSVGAYDWLWRRTTFRISDRAHVQWAATLTGRARVELHRQIEHAGSAWAYSDTDSVYATRRLKRNVGEGLGEWKFEGEGLRFEALAPKLYRYDALVPAPEGQEGPSQLVTHARAKGIPDAADSWSLLSQSMPVDLDKGVKSFLQAAAGGGALFQRQRARRQVRPDPEWCGARLRIPGSHGTRAPHWEDLSRLAR